eukprot:TRINITY_DN4079_c0_g1_i4.p1 TRINITY_DN4079_c0_g1~~TRINITY_DN4079_c0_g1_i4.p1  ORF type:complete len:351 (-),score=106.05 TRINITY_DN4079_c0_g1_i4:23-1075(-)
MLLKSLMTYMQIIAIFNPFGPTFNPTKNVVGNPVLSFTYYIECFFPNSMLDRVTLNLFLAIFMPGIEVFFAAFVFLYLKCTRRLEDTFGYFSTASLVIFTNLHPEIFNFLLLITRCDNTLKKEGIYFMKVDSEYLCGTDQHKLLMIWSYSALAIYIVIPIIFQLILTCYKSRLNETSVRLRYGYLYNDYKEKNYYWELLKTFLKSSLIALGLFFEFDDKIKSMTLILFLAIYYQMVRTYKPFIFEQLNDLETNVTLVYILTIYLSFYVRDNDYTVLRYPAYAMLVVSNVLFLLVTLALLAKSYQESYGGRITSIFLTIGDFFRDRFIGGEAPAEEKRPEVSIESPMIKQK